MNMFLSRLGDVFVKASIGINAVHEDERCCFTWQMANLWYFFCKVSDTSMFSSRRGAVRSFWDFPFFWYLTDVIAGAVADLENKIKQAEAIENAWVRATPIVWLFIRFMFKRTEHADVKLSRHSACMFTALCKIRYGILSASLVEECPKKWIILSNFLPKFKTAIFNLAFKTFWFKWILPSFCRFQGSSRRRRPRGGACGLLRWPLDLQRSQATLPTGVGPWVKWSCFS